MSVYLLPARRWYILGLLILLVLVAGTVRAAGDEDVDFLNDDFYAEEGAGTEVPDPLEPLNRVMFNFNDKAYLWVLKPVATTYADTVPWEMRWCVDSFFNNLLEPVRFANALLQLRLGDAGTILGRFFINTTLGVFGLADVAEREFEIATVEASLGETLAAWGIGDGLYLVIPFYGSTTLRDFTGTMAETLVTPYYLLADSWKEEGLIYAGKNINNLTFHLGEYEHMKELSFDPYIALRNGYFQYRRQQRSRAQGENNNE
ncbi:MlaA family lipoprotein [Desulfolithobacter sp.]